MNTKKREAIVGNPALIVIDFQNDFIRSGAPIECEGGKDAVTNTIPLIYKAREVGIPVIFTQEYHRNPEVYGYHDFGRECDGVDPIHTVRGTPGFELVDELSPLAEDDYLIEKPRYSAFFGTDLDLILRSHKVDTLIITGVCTNICVHYTAVDAHQRDYFVRVVKECVAGTSPEAHEAALVQIHYLQFGGVQKLEDILEALNKIANLKDNGKACLAK